MSFSIFLPRFSLDGLEITGEQGVGFVFVFVFEDFRIGSI